MDATLTSDPKVSQKTKQTYFYIPNPVDKF